MMVVDNCYEGERVSASTRERTVSIFGKKKVEPKRKRDVLDFGWSKHTNPLFNCRVDRSCSAIHSRPPS